MYPINYDKPVIYEDINKAADAQKKNHLPQKWLKWGLCRECQRGVVTKWFNLSLSLTYLNPKYLVENCPLLAGKQDKMKLWFNQSTSIKY